MTHDPVADSLGAYAKLYGQLAKQSCSEFRAQQLRATAHDCLTAANDLDAYPTQERLSSSK